MSYVTKLGAYGLAVVATFAVALAVLMSVSSTVHAQAAPDHTLAAGANSIGTEAAPVAPGDTVRIEVGSAFASVSITGTADGVSGSFDANDGQSIACGDAATCDKDTNASAVAVDLTIDADSGEGHILLSVGGLGGAPTTKVINVSKAGLAGSLSVTVIDKTIAAADDTDTTGVTENQTPIVVVVKNASATPLGLNGETVTLVTTLGTISCDGTNYVQACTTTATVDSVPGTTPGVPGTADAAPGYATATFRGGGVEGVATITATLGSLTDTVDVTMYGDAKNLSAEPEQGSVEIGGSVYVVLTVTDAAGNPVSGATVEAGTPKEVVGPGDDAVLVVTETNTAARADNTDDVVGVGYSKDKVGATAAGNIPACGEDNSDIDGQDGTATELFATEGTNDKGQCVVHVTAPDGGTDATTATRGEHTLHFRVAGATTVKASATIEVAGKPSSISTDAPVRVDPASVTEITVSVFDDEDVLVGITEVTVRKVGGDGLIEDQGDGNTEKTSDGQSKFTFIAPSAAGSSEILITAGTVNHRVELQIGDPAPEVMDCPDGSTVPVGDDCPEPPAEAATLMGSGALRWFSGGSLDDLGAVVADACPGGSTIWVEDGDGGWQSWISAAPDFANVGFTTAFADGFADGVGVFVASCEADGMSDDGMDGNGMEDNGG